MSEAVIAAVAYLSEGEVVLTAIEAASIVTTAFEVAAVVASVYTTQQQQRRAQQDQRDQYNSSLRDRYVMSRGATEPRQMVLGRERVSGPIFFLQSYGANREHLVLCVALAAHEIDAIEAIYFDDEQVLLDGSGNVIGVNRRETFSLAATGGTFTLQGTPKAGSVSAAVKYGTTSVTLGTSVTGTAVTVTGGTAGATGALTISYQPNPCPYVPTVGTQVTLPIALNGSGDGSATFTGVLLSGSVVAVVGSPGGDLTDVDVTSYATVVGNVITVTGCTPFAGLFVYASFQITSGHRARIRKYLGGPGQAADSAMVANLPGVWTSAHTATGVAYLVVELDFDPDAFPHGLPNISATVRGAKVYDPRTGTTAWSENPALLMRHAALHPLCGRLPASVVNDASVIVAANACDVSTAYVVNGQTFTRPRYTAGTVVRSGTRGQDVLNDLAQAMGGKWAFIEGQLKVRAGAYVTPLQTLDETWLSGTSPVQVQPRANRADVFNVITGKFADEASDYQVLDVPRVASIDYIAEDGAELPISVQFNAVTFTGQAQQLEAQMMRDARQGLRVSLACNMRADAVEWGDFLNVNLSRFGWVGKVFEVLDTAYTIDGGIALTLKETSSTIWDIGTAFAASDPAPNTFLPSPFVIPPVAGLIVDSSNTVQVRASDGTVLQRMRVSWSPLADQGVLASGGGVEVRYGRAGQAEAQWISEIGEGSSTQVDIVNVQPGQLYLVKARAFNALVNGAWSSVVKHTVGTRSIAIDTPQIVDGAVTTPKLPANVATEVFSSVVSSPVTITQQSGVTGGGVRLRTTVATLVFTPTETCDALITVVGKAFYTVAAGGTSSELLHFLFSTNFVLVSGSAYQLMAASTSRGFDTSLSTRMSVTAGTTYTITYGASKFLAGDTVSIDSAELRVEVIKR